MIATALDESKVEEVAVSGDRREGGPPGSGTRDGYLEPTYGQSTK
jgi:hypothetical protein